MNSQSIILNLNKNFAKSEAFNYLQPVSQAFDIGEKAEVALYGAALQRKPLLVEEAPTTTTSNTGRVDLNVDLNFLPTNQQINDYLNPASTLIDSDNVPLLSQKLTANIETKAYSVDELSSRLVLGLNSNITQEINGKPAKDLTSTPILINAEAVKIQIPYAMEYSRDEYYLGLQGVPGYLIDNEVKGQYPVHTTGQTLNSQIFAVDNTETTATSNITVSLNSGSYITQIEAGAGLSLSNWSQFAIASSSPLFPLMKQDSGDQIKKGFSKNQSYFEWKLDFEQDSNYEFDACVGFSNTYLQSNWTSSDVPTLHTITPEGVGSVSQYPEVVLGCRINEKVGGSEDFAFLEVFCPATLSEKVEYLSDDTEPFSELFVDGMTSLAKIDMTTEKLDGLTVGFRFVAHDNQRDVAEQIFKDGASDETDGLNPIDRAYSFQLYINDNEGQKIVYDSAIKDIYFPSNLIEDGIFANAAVSKRNGAQRTNLGLQPYTFWNSCEAGDTISACRGNYNLIYATDYYIYRMPADFYTLETQSKSLREILGISEVQQTDITINKGSDKHKITYKEDNVKRFDPNAYPRYPDEAGLTRLYSDNTQYNIEVNLPIKAYNTTNQSINNIGQKRTIIYKSEPIVDGESQGIKQVYVNKNIVPNTLKFLTLNNDAKLDLNNMNVQIRRAHNNELAKELQDASIELLVKSN